MSSLFEVPSQLVLILSLAAAGAAEPPPRDRLEAASPNAAISSPAPAASAASGAAPSAAASAPTFEFGEQAWLEAVQTGAGGQAMAGHASRVFRTSSGRFYVPTDRDRREILEWRSDPAVLAAVAFGFARINARSLGSLLSRPVSAGDLYLAHVFGSDLAMAVLRAAETEPDSRLDVRVPGLARAASELAPGLGRTVTVAAFVDRIRAAVERKPTGSQVAQWFKRPKGARLAEPATPSQSLTPEPAIHASIIDEPGGEEQQGWAGLVQAAPDAVVPSAR